VVLLRKFCNCTEIDFKIALLYSSCRAENVGGGLRSPGRPHQGGLQLQAGVGPGPLLWHLRGELAILGGGRGGALTNAQCHLAEKVGKNKAEKKDEI
jgi:hypothetical protein